MLLKFATPLLIIVVELNAFTGNARGIQEDVDRLIGEYQTVVDATIAWTNQNLQLSLDTVNQIGNEIMSNSSVAILAVRDRYLDKFSELEDLGKDAGVDVSMCIEDQTSRFNLVADILRHNVNQCQWGRITQSDTQIRQMFANMNTSIISVDYYQRRLQDCQSAANLEECIIRIIVQVSASIEFLPVFIQQDLNDVRERVEEMIISYRECYTDEAADLSFQGDLILVETRSCVDTVIGQQTGERA